MMKTGILTYQNQLNYGGILQAYALQEVVREFDSSAVLIQYHCIPGNWQLTNDGLQAFMSPWKRGSQKRLWLRFAYPKFVLESNKRKQRTLHFLDAYIGQTEQTLKSEKDLATLQIFDVVIVGSDQVWKYSSPNIRAYLLADLPKDVRRIAYAVSLGVETIPEEWKPVYREALASFAFVSVREPSSVSTIQALAPEKMKVENCLDPTLLLPRDHWRKMVPSSNPIEPYVFLYWLGDLTGLLETIRSLRRQGHKKIRLFFSWYLFALGAKPSEIKRLNQTMKDGIVESCFEAGPLEFLGGVAQAKLVVSDSFHALIFATIFEKPMKIFINSSKHRISSANRIHDFAMYFGLNLSAFNENKNEFVQVPENYYAEIWKRLEQEIERSKEFLEKALKKSMSKMPSNPGK